MQLFVVPFSYEQLISPCLERTLTHVIDFLGTVAELCDLPFLFQVFVAASRIRSHSELLLLPLFMVYFLKNRPDICIHTHTHSHQPLRYQPNTKDQYAMGRCIKESSSAKHSNRVKYRNTRWLRFMTHFKLATVNIDGIHFSGALLPR